MTPSSAHAPASLSFVPAVFSRLRGMDVGGVRFANFLVANVVSPTPGSPRPSKPPMSNMAVMGIALIIDSVILGMLSGLSAIAGFGWETVKQHPGAVAFTFLFAFLLQALRFLARARGLDPKPPQ